MAQRKADMWCCGDSMWQPSQRISTPPVVRVAATAARGLQAAQLRRREAITVRTAALVQARFMHALDVAVCKSRRGMKKGFFDKDQLVKDVLAAAAAYPTEQLEKMWDYKSYVMEQVKASKGGNDYPRHRA